MRKVQIVSFGLFQLLCHFTAFIFVIFIYFSIFIYLFIGSKACRILVSQAGIKPISLQWKHSPNHWTTREIPIYLFIYLFIYLLQCLVNESMIEQIFWKLYFILLFFIIF